jgi:hypothetical protein
LHDPGASHHVDGRPASVFTPIVHNDGAAPLGVTIAMLVDGGDVGESLDGGRAAHKTTIAVGDRHSWSIAVEDAVSSGGTIEVRVEFRWLFRAHSLTVPRGGWASF